MLIKRIFVRVHTAAAAEMLKICLKNGVIIKIVESISCFMQPEQFFEVGIVQIHLKPCCTNQKLHIGRYHWYDKIKI